MVLALPIDDERAAEYFAIDDEALLLLIHRCSTDPTINLRAHYVKLLDLYIVHSYIYYTLHRSLIADSVYNQLCRCLLKHLTKMRSMRLWWDDLLNEDALRGCTAFHISAHENYPKGYPIMHTIVARKMVALIEPYKDTRKDGQFSYFI